MAFRIVWSRAATNDFRSLVKFIARDSSVRAEQFGYKIISRIQVLRDYPQIGRVVPEFQRWNLRELLLEPFRIIYRINNSSKLIEIVRIWHAARDTPQIL